MPLAVLGVFFVLPVAGMLAEGFWPDGEFDPGGGARGARPAAGAPGAVVHRLDRRPVATLVSVLLGLPAAYALHRLDVPACGGRCGRCCWCRSCCRPSWSAWPSAQLLGEAGPLGFLGLDGTPVAIVAGLVFFNVAVVIRTVGAAWESLDPPARRGGRGPRRQPGAGVAHGHPARAAARDRVGRERGLPVLRDRVRRRAHPRRRRATPPSRPRSTCSPPTCSTCRRPRRCRSCSWSWWSCCWWSPAGCARCRTPPSARGDPPAAPARAGPTCPPLAATALLLALVAAPIVTLVVGSLRVDGGWSLGNYRALQTEGDRARRCWCRSPTRWSTRCAPRSTRPGWRCCSGCSSRSS